MSDTLKILLIIYGFLSFLIGLIACQDSTSNDMGLMISWMLFWPLFTAIRVIKATLSELYCEFTKN